MMVSELASGDSGFNKAVNNRRSSGLFEIKWKTDAKENNAV
jgi:hypothetical protein